MFSILLKNVVKCKDVLKLIKTIIKKEKKKPQNKGGEILVVIEAVIDWVIIFKLSTYSFHHKIYPSHLIYTISKYM